MDDDAPVPTGWRDLADAFPGAVGFQSGEEFVYASGELARTVGVPADEVVGEPWRTLFDESEADRLEREAVETARTDGRWEGVVRVNGTGDGGTPTALTLSATEAGPLVWAFSDGSPPASDGPSHDDAAEDRPNGREPRPLASPALVRSVLDAVDDAVYVADGDGRMRFCNEAFVETTGYSRTELSAMDPSELLPGADGEDAPLPGAAVDAAEDRRVEVDVRTKDGERIPHEFTGTAVEDPGTGEVFRCGVARDVTDRRERERRLERYETIVETVDDGIYALDEELRFAFVNEGFCEMVGMDREEVVGLAGHELYSDSEEWELAAEIRQRVVESDTSTGTIRGTLPRPDGDRVLESHYRLHPEPDGEFRGSVGVVRDVTERIERERAIERQRDELAALDRTNELLLETVRELIRTESRDAVERAVCERLAASEFYRFAWVGERELDGDRVVPRVTAGDDPGPLEDVAVPGDGGGTGRGPVGRAMATGEVQVESVDDDSFEPFRDDASEAGVESVAAVPLHDGESVYGVLVVYATREDAFSPREQDGFDVLGRTVGLVIHAARSHELLFADAVVELEFRVRNDDSPFFRAAADLACELALEGYVASGDRWILYLSVEGAPPGDVVDAVAADRRIERARVVRDDGADGQVELVASSPPLLDTVTAVGGVVTTAVVGADDGRVVVEVPAGIDVREVGEHVGNEFPLAELQARRDRDREVRTVGRPGGVVDALTDRQREVLEAAYRAGYFAWPRESTAEDVAETLDIAPSTLHGHLRKAEAVVLSGLFDVGDAGA